MRNLFLAIATLLFTFSIAAQEKVGDLIPLAKVPESIALMEHANSYAMAIVNQDYTKVASMTHADIVEMGGGEQFLISDLETQAQNLERQGLKYVSAEVGSHPEFLTAGDEMQCVVPVKYYLDMNSKKVESWSNLLAVSSDEGGSWKFVDLDKFDDASLRDFVKNISADFAFPK